jgi:hypothetical protein
VLEARRLKYQHQAEGCQGREHVGDGEIQCRLVTGACPVAKPSSTKPALAMAEYASRRLMLVCAIATTLPSSSDSDSDGHEHLCPVFRHACETVREQPRNQRERAQPFDTVAMNRVTLVGAPW